MASLGNLSLGVQVQLTNTMIIEINIEIKKCQLLEGAPLHDHFAEITSGAISWPCVWASRYHIAG